MYRGTTPTLCFSLLSLNKVVNVSEMWITLRNLIQEFTYTLEDENVRFEQDQGKVYVTLSQEETLMLNPGKMKCQIRYLDKNGFAYATECKTVDVNDILADGVIGDLGVSGTNENNVSFDVLMQVEEGQVLSGTDNYDKLINKPTLNETVLVGSVTLSDIGIEKLPLSDIEKMFEEW